MTFQYFFTIKYDFFCVVHSSCRGDHIKTTGTQIKYPLKGKYGANEACVWTVDTPGKVEVKVTRFDIEPKCNGYDCDYVEIRERYGKDGKSQRKSKWSGKEGKGKALVFNGKFTVHLRSDGQKHYNGFQMDIKNN